MQRRHLVAGLFAVALGVVPATASAQSPPSDADKATARELAQDGLAALDKKDFTTAEDRFRRADQIVHAPTIALGLARAQTGTGKFVEAQETYNRIIRDGAPSGSPASWSQAVADARREVDAVSNRVASVVISVSGADSPKVLLDDAPVPNAALGIKRAVNPGAHVVKATADGYKPAEARFSVEERGTQTATLTLERDPNAPAPGAAAGPGPASGPAAGGTHGGSDGPIGATGGSTQRTLGFVALGIGAAGLAFGGVTGFLALGKHSDLKSKCTNPDGSCPADVLDDVDSYRSMGTLSTVGFIVGGVGAATGIVLILTAPHGASASKSQGSSGRFVQPYAGLGTVGAYGRF